MNSEAKVTNTFIRSMTAIAITMIVGATAISITEKLTSSK